MTVQEEVAKILLKTKAVTLNPKNPYKYTSGIISPIYTDCRLLTSFPKERRIIVKHLVSAVRKFGKPDVVAGTATAGISWAAWVSEAMNLPMVYVRGKAKEHGKKKQVEGLIKKGQKVIIIEDLISTAKSSLETAEGIKIEKGRVLGIAAIFSYQLEVSKTNLKSAKIKLSPLTTFQELIPVAVKNKYISEKDKEIVLEWSKDPKSWGV